MCLFKWRPSLTGDKHMKTLPANPTRSIQTRLNCEQLESRTTPSNVNAVFNSSNYLVVIGDNGNNVILVEENTQGDYFVIGENGTNVNGKTNQQTSAVGFGAIHPVGVVIEDGNGNDRIEVLGVHASNGFLVSTGSGSDFVNLEGVVANYVLVNERGASSTLETASVVAGTGASIVTEGGDSVWYDYSLVAGRYIDRSGWSEIIS
jgi:hypothetical protein